MKYRQSGASLVEVLVAALILSLGMLVLMGVQASSVQLAQLAQFRAEANRLGQSMVDRIRANPNNVNGYALTTAYSGNDAIPAAPAACATTCSVAAFQANMTGIDLSDMRQQARNTLPAGDIRIVVTNTAGVGNVVNVWLLWQQATTQSDTDGTLRGTGCPTTITTPANTQCLLTRVAI